MPLSARWRHVVTFGLLAASGIQALVGLLGGPEPLGLYVVWIAYISFGLHLKGQADRGRRLLLWLMVIGGVLGLANDILRPVLRD